MKKLIYFGFATLLAIAVIYSCKDEPVNLDAVKSDSKLGERVDPCSGVTMNCTGQFTTQDFMVFDSQFPNCTFYINISYRVCDPLADVKINYYYSNPPCEDWFDYISNLPAGQVVGWMRDFELRLLGQAAKIIGASFADPCGVAGTPFTIGSYHASCFKFCIVRVGQFSLKVIPIYCGEGCCKVNFYICYDSNGILQETHDTPASIGTCTTSPWDPPTDGCIFATPCRSRCN